MNKTTPLLTPAEAAAAFGVNTKTLIKWANDGKITSQRTLGNHRRFVRSEIEALLTGPTTLPAPEELIDADG